MALPQTKEQAQHLWRLFVLHIYEVTAERNYKEWLRRVHDMPNSDYQSGLRWFRERLDYVRHLTKEVE